MYMGTVEVVLIIILQSFRALFSKWPVIQKQLVMDYKETDTRTSHVQCTFNIVVFSHFGVMHLLHYFSKNIFKTLLLLQL